MKTKLKEILLFILLLTIGLLSFSCEKTEDICGCVITEITHDKLILESTMPNVICNEYLHRVNDTTPSRHSVGDCTSRISY